MKSFCVLMKESDGAIALVNSNRPDYADLLLSNYVPIQEGSRNELEDWLTAYFETNDIAVESRLYLTIK